jgi:hypothetical protein
MKDTKTIRPVRWFCLTVLLLGLAGASPLQAEPDIWILPGSDMWMGEGRIGSPVDPSLVVIWFQNGLIQFVPASEIAGFLQKGAATGWPNVAVLLIVFHSPGKPEVVPIWKVAEELRKGAQMPTDDIVVMHKGKEHIAVTKAQIDEYKTKGYELGPRNGWTEGVVMCHKNQLVVVAKNAVEKYKKQGAELGPCKK